jgi:hypothetical protein
MNKYLAAAIMSALALQLTSSAAWADNRYAKACVKNETTADMKFSWRFGNDPWKHVELRPGQEEIFSYQYAKVNANRSPYLYIRYDAKMSGKKVETKQLELYRAAGNDNCNQAKKHAFRVEASDSGFISLYQIN